MRSDLIKIRTTIPQGVVIAGRPFTLTTTINNTHDQPIEILAYYYHIPYQVQWINDSIFDSKFAEFKSKPVLSRLFSSSIWRAATSPPGQVMAYRNFGEPKQPVQTIAPNESQS
jgi:hypothetical protein